MASILLADNGASSGSAGLKSSADSSGQLSLQTTTSGGTATTAVTIDNSQNVGIGTTSVLGNSSLNVNTGITARTAAASGVTPYLQVYNGNAGADLKTWRIGGGSNGQLTIETANDAYTSSSVRMMIDSSGNAGLGVTPSAWGSGQKYLQLGTAASIGGSSNNSQLVLRANNYYNGTNDIYINSNYATVYQQLSGQHIWYNAASGTAGGTVSFTQAMTLTNTGHLLVGTTTDYAPLSVISNGSYSACYIVANTTADGALDIVNNASGSMTLVKFANSGGTVGTITYNGSLTLYNQTSDYRLKNITGIVTADEAKTFIMALQPKQGTWKSDGSKFVGFVAHEFQEVSPSSVTGEKDAVDEDGKPIMQAMQASSPEVMANLIALVQEQQALITQLQADVALLKGKA